MKDDEVLKKIKARKIINRRLAEAATEGVSDLGI